MSKEKWEWLASMCPRCLQYCCYDWYDLLWGVSLVEQCCVFHINASPPHLFLSLILFPILFWHIQYCLYIKSQIHFLIEIMSVVFFLFWFPSIKIHNALIPSLSEFDIYDIGVHSRPNYYFDVSLHIILLNNVVPPILMTVYLLTIFLVFDKRKYPQEGLNLHISFRDTSI